MQDEKRPCVMLQGFAAHEGDCVRNIAAITTKQGYFLAKLTHGTIVEILKDHLSVKVRFPWSDSARFRRKNPDVDIWVEKELLQLVPREAKEEPRQLTEHEQLVMERARVAEMFLGDDLVTNKICMDADPDTVARVRANIDAYTKNQVGSKTDHGKERFDLVDPVWLSGIARVLTFGAEKYAPGNWKEVPDAHRRYFAAAQRHILAWWMGEDVDAETGEDHLHHASCCLMFLSRLKDIPAQAANDPRPGFKP